MGIGSGSLDGNGNDVEETWEFNGKWKCWYESGREWKLGTHSRTPLVWGFVLQVQYICVKTEA